MFDFDYKHYYLLVVPNKDGTRVAQQGSSIFVPAAQVSGCPHPQEVNTNWQNPNRSGQGTNARILLSSFNTYDVACADV